MSTTRKTKVLLPLIAVITIFGLATLFPGTASAASADYEIACIFGENQAPSQPFTLSGEVEESSVEPGAPITIRNLQHSQPTGATGSEYAVTIGGQDIPLGTAVSEPDGSATIPKDAIINAPDTPGEFALIPTRVIETFPTGLEVECPVVQGDDPIGVVEVVASEEPPPTSEPETPPTSEPDTPPGDPGTPGLPGAPGTPGVTPAGGAQPVAARPSYTG